MQSRSMFSRLHAAHDAEPIYVHLAARTAPLSPTLISTSDAPQQNP